MVKLTSPDTTVDDIVGNFIGDDDDDDNDDDDVTENCRESGPSSQHVTKRQ